jgi:hypothetical protein
MEKGQMASVIMKSEQLTNLAASFKGGDGVYDETTCIEFHRLLVATLLAYGRALFTLSKHQEGSGNIVEKYNRVFICASLLRQIASSPMVRQHLQACQPQLQIPQTNFAHTSGTLASLLKDVNTVVRMTKMTHLSKTKGCSAGMRSSLHGFAFRSPIW